jgi:hypothetical protein
MSQINYDDLIETIEATDIDSNLLCAYARLWQFETWLRHMVYVEFQAKYGLDWGKKFESNRLENHRKKDKSLTHMPTPEQYPISFISFGELCNAISDEWQLFSTYLPPKQIWEAKLEEVQQIRNRVAHYRTLHRDDLSRIIQLMRDADKGFWDFCVSMNASHSKSFMSNDIADPIINHFSCLNPWNSGNSGQDKYGHFFDSIELSIEVNVRPWNLSSKPSQVLGEVGFLYDIRLIGINNTRFDTKSFLEKSSNIHKFFTYLCFQDTEHIIRAILSTTLEKDIIINIIDNMIHQAMNTRSWRSLSDIEQSFEKVQSMVDKYAENIIGPKNPITFLSPDMPCTFFAV